MEVKKNNFLKNSLMFLLSIPLGYSFYWFISLKVINAIYYIDTLSKGLFLCFCHIFLAYFLLKIIFNMKVYQYEKIILIISYFILMFLSFFDRVYLGDRIINLNPFDIINTIYNDGIMTLLLNIVIFCPFYTAMRWIKREANIKFTFILFFLFAISIEIVQYFTMSGIFDVIDIILYIIGYFIGVLIYKFIFFEGEYR